MYLICKNKDMEIMITENDIKSIDATFDAAEADTMVLGGAIPSEIKISIFNEQNQFSDFKFYGSTIQLFNDNGKKLGKFISSIPKIVEDIINIEGNDQLANADITWGGAVFPLTEYELLLNVCEQLDLPMNVSQEELPNANILIMSSSGLKDEKCRNIIRYIAEANGKFAFLNGDGRLEFKNYDFNNIIKKVSRDFVKNLEIEEMETIRDGVNIDSRFSYGSTSNPLMIKGNPLLSNLSDSNIQISANKIYNEIEDMKYFATSLETWDENNDLWLGDVYEVENRDGVYIKTIVQNISIGSSTKYQGFGDTLEGKTKNTTSNDNTSSGSTNESESGEISFAKTNNAMQINAKQGSFTICEKKIDNVSKFTKVFITLSGRFTYTPNEKAKFQIFADSIKIKEFEIKSEGTQDFTFSFLGDTLQAKSIIYSAKVVVAADHEVNIMPFAIEMSLLVKNGSMEDVYATDQLFFEKIKKINVGEFNSFKLNVGSINDNMNYVLEDLTIDGGPWDISLLQNGTVMATLYDNGLLYVKGDGTNEMKTYGAYGTPPWLEDSLISNKIKKIEFKNLYNLAKGIGRYSNPNNSNIKLLNLKEIKLGSDIKIFGDSSYGTFGCFPGTFENNVLIYFVNDECGAEKIHENAFEWIELSTLGRFGLTFTYVKPNILENSLGTVKLTKKGVELSTGAFSNSTLPSKIYFKCCNDIPAKAFEKTTGLTKIEVLDVPYKIEDDVFVKYLEIGDFCFDNSKDFKELRTNLEGGFIGQTTYDLVIPQENRIIFIRMGAFKNTNVQRVFVPGVVRPLSTGLMNFDNAFYPQDGAFKKDVNFDEDDTNDNDVTIIPNGISCRYPEIETLTEYLKNRYGFTKDDGTWIIIPEEE